MRAFAPLLKTELRLALRSMDMVLFAVLMPVVVLVVIGLIYGGAGQENGMIGMMFAIGLVIASTARDIKRAGMIAIMVLAVSVLIGCADRRPGDTTSPAASLPPVDARPLDEYTAHLDTQLPRLMERYGVPGVAIAIVREGTVVWSSAYGYADLESGRPMTVDTICRAESISKPVTAWGVMRLVEDGRIDLDAPVRDYLPDLRFADSDLDDEAVTVGQLLSHQSGLPLGTIGPPSEYPPGSSMPTAREFIETDARLVAEPGSGFVYSDVGFNILQLAVEGVTGEPFAGYMQREVLAPLGMDNSSYAWQEAYAGAIATGYEIDGTPVEPYVYPAEASGGLLADVDDIARFVAAEVGGFAGGLSADSVDAMHEQRVEIPGLYGFVADGYAYGHFVEQLSDGRTAVWHGGQGHGWMTHFHAVPDTGDGIVVLTNSQRSWPFLARILTDWARWSGVGTVNFGLITRATTFVWALIGLLGVAALWQLARLVVGLVRGSRQLAPFSKSGAVTRAVQFVVGGLLLALVAWRISLPYVDEASVFPAAAPWLAAVTIALGAALVASALLAPAQIAAEQRR